MNAALTGSDAPRKPLNSNRLALLLSLGAALGASLVSSGCGLRKDLIEIGYQAAASAPKVQGADAVGVGVRMVDSRAIKDNVGRKGSEFDYLGPFIPVNDVAVTIAKALEQELVHRGFKLESGGVPVLVELRKFYTEFDRQAAIERAEVIMDVQVRKPDSTVVFSKTVIGRSAKSGLIVIAGDDAKETLDAALKEAIGGLVNDKDFLASLLKAGGKEDTLTFQ